MVLLVEVVLVKYSTFPVVGITSVEELYLQNLVLLNELCNNDGNQDPRITTSLRLLSNGLTSIQSHE